MIKGKVKPKKYLIKEDGHWHHGYIVDVNRPGKWLLKCVVCGELFEGVVSNSVGEFKKGGTNHGKI